MNSSGTTDRGRGRDMGRGGDRGRGHRVNRALELNYHFDPKTSHGNLDDESILPVFVDVGRQHQSRLQSIRIVHDNFLPIVGNNSYTDSQDNRPMTDTIYHEFAQDLSSYVNDDNTPSLVCDYCIPAVDCPEDKRIRYYYLNDHYRKLFRGVIKFMIFLHHRWNLSLMTLKLDENFVVHEHKIKLYRLRFKACTTDSRRNDFSNLARVLQKLFAEKVMPMEVDDLCQCMNSYTDSYEGIYIESVYPIPKTGDHILLKNHLAVLTTSKRITLIKNFFEKKQLVAKNLYEDVLSDMPFLDWTVRFKAREPGLGPAQACYDQKKVNSDEGMYDMQVHNNFHLNETMIKICRNFESHLRKEIPKHRLDGQCHYEDVDLIIMALFGKPLLSFARLAQRNRILWILCGA